MEEDNIMQAFTCHKQDKVLVGSDGPILHKSEPKWLCILYKI